MRRLMLLLALCFPAFAQAAPWYLDQSQTKISVQVGYLGAKGVTVRFPSFGGKIDFDAKRPQNAKAVIKVRSTDLETGFGLVNNIVRSKDYLNTRAFPEITFQLDKLEQTSKSAAIITGRITLLGVTRPITFDATVTQYGPSKRNADVFVAGFDLSAEIDRRLFGSTAGVPQVAPVLPVRIKLVMTSQPV